MVLIVPLCEMIYSFAIVFISGEIGEHVSNAFNEIDNETRQFVWHLFSMEIRMVLPILFMATQKPVDIVVFGSILCNRENFKKVSQ